MRARLDRMMDAALVAERRRRRAWAIAEFVATLLAQLGALAFVVWLAVIILRSMPNLGHDR